MILLALFLTLIARTEDFSGQPEMNGIAWEKYQDFAREWRLVTVRYRQDTSEMRFTYANQRAWKSLNENVTNFPDGAAFAKIGVLTKADPAFLSSSVPSGVRRFQLMVRDKKKYSDTDGWGYALFDDSGKTFSEDPVSTAKACAACHRLVEDRGFIFSQPMGFMSSNPPSWQPRVAFKTTARKALPQQIAKLLPARHQQVRQLEGEMSQNLFQGTLDEIRPHLMHETLASKMPTVLYKEKRFSLVVPTGKKCAPGETHIATYRTQLNKSELINETRCVR